MEDAPKAPDFYVGNLPVYGRLILAPMQGYSDLPYRSLCREQGSAMSYTEFINAMEVLQGGEHIAQKCAFYPHERPVVFQLFDNSPERLLNAALRLLEYQPDVIDINLGCSVRRVSGRGAGAGLLRQESKIAHIFRLLSASLPVPVTAKMRLGWDDHQRNYLEVARIIEQSGGQMIAVHGRTRAQGYSGQADWEAIAEIKETVSVPVIANGDVRSQEDIRKIMDVTHCDGVMIGRAAVGNPWIFSGLERAQVPPEEVQKKVMEHLKRMVDHYGESRGLLLFRKHLKGYLGDYQLPAQELKALLTENHLPALREHIISIFENIARVGTVV